MIITTIVDFLRSMYERLTVETIIKVKSYPETNILFNAILTSKSNIKITEIINNNPELFTVDKDGNSPLHLVIAMRDSSLAQLLISLGANQQHKKQK